MAFQWIPIPILMGTVLWVVGTNSVSKITIFRYEYINYRIITLSKGKYCQVVVVRHLLIVLLLILSSYNSKNIISMRIYVGGYGD